MRHRILAGVIAAALAACGGGGETVDKGSAEGVSGPAEAVAGATPASATTSSTPQTASASASSASPSAGTDTPPVATHTGSSPSASVLTGLAAGTYVGHWTGYTATTTTVDRFNLGGAMLRFTPETYGKLKATGANDVIAKVYPNDIQTVRIGVAITGDLYSDDTIYGQGIGVHFYNTQMAGTYDRAKRLVSLTTYPTGTGNFGVRCKYCDGAFVLPPVIYARYALVGTSLPSQFKLSVTRTKLSWTPVAGVDHWLVSIFDENGTWVFDQDSYAAPATLPLASAIPAAQGDLDYFITEFLDKLLYPAGKRELALPELTKGTRYIAAVTGFAPNTEAVASTSLRFTAP